MTIQGRSASVVINDTSTTPIVTSGYQTLYFNNGIYQGDTRNSLMDGFGKITFTNGEYYEGNFSNGLYSGSGKYNYLSGIIFSGSYVNGSPNGLGTMTWPDGMRFSGNYVNGLRSGTGTLTLTDGTTLTGNYSNDTANGLFTVKYLNGTQSTVNYVDGIARTDFATSPTYQVESLTATVNEGAVAKFSVSTTGIEVGTSIEYTLSGIQASDIVGGELSGSAVIGVNGKASISVPIAADQLTEG